MTVRARTRVLLILAVAVLGAAVYEIVSEQRTVLLRGQAQTASAGDLLTAMLDQQTGVRAVAAPARSRARGSASARR